VSTSSFCEKYCGRVNECDNTKDAQTCANNCQNSLSSTLPKLRGDVTSQIEACMDSKDCKTVLGSNVTGKCVDEAAESIAPSAAAKSFCDDYATAKKKCNVIVDKASCLAATKVYTDATVSSANSCLSKACSDITACVNSAFGWSSSSSSSSGSPSPSPSGSGGTSGDAGAPPKG
jgi:hypothetical protein